MSALHLLDDFIESIETLPSEIQQQLQLLHEKDFQIEELQKNLFKKRTVLLKANEKNFDESMQISLKKRAEKDAQKVSHLLDEKIQIQSNLLQIVEQHQQRLLKEVYKPLDLQPENNFYHSEAAIFGDIPEPQLQGNGSSNKKTTNMMKQAQVGNISSSLSSISSSGSGGDLVNEKLVIEKDKQISRGTSPRPPLLTFSTESSHNSPTASLKTSPKKRASLEDEPPVDPNEPVYCYCKQVSWGEMVACDGPKCQSEWFHLACVGLNAPPEGKWYCNDCRNKIK